VAAVGLGGLLLAGGCSSAASGQAGQATPGAPAGAAPAATAQPTAVTPRTVSQGTLTPGTSRFRVTKILVIMEENHSTGQVFPAGMPYLWSLARRFGRATAWSAIGHPSLPNYLAIFAGSAFGYPRDCPPAPGCQYPGPSVFGQAIAAGRTARAYEESMPAPCAAAGRGPYDVHHNPWAYFPSEGRWCRSGDVPAGTPARGRLAADARAGSLPDVGLVTPDVNHDAHNGTLAAADSWLRSWLPVLMSGPDWRAGRLAIVVVFDEGTTTQQVPFVLIARGVSGAVDRRPANHYALTRLIDEIAGTRLLRNAARAADIAPSLGLRLR
jgi:phosphatidylinositol-3-phosphatase